MEIINERQTIERIQFFTGQRLFASDMQILEGFNREMRRLHNASLHQAGVGMGFSVSGEVGNREVTIAPGYAVDSRGREIVLTQKRILLIPPVSDDGFGNPVNYDLAIYYPDERLLEEAETIERIQLPNEAIRLREEPMFHWVELDHNLQPKDDKLKLDIKNGLKLILKRIGIQNCRLTRIHTDIKVRKAHPEKLPFVFACAADAKITEWEFWKEENVTIGLKAFVNTSSAEFNYPPRYFVRVAGKRFVIDENVSPSEFLLEGFVNITEAESMPLEKGFELRLLMPHIPEDGKVNRLPINPPDFFNLDENKINQILGDKWQIVWMGIEE